jgi:magnesium chelatase family protein
VVARPGSGKERALLAKIESVALVGTEARPVQVEVFVGQGVPTFRVVGLPSASVREAEQRVRGALEESSERWPPHKIVANLAPGALRKEGTHFDLAIALAVVAADKRLDPAVLQDVVAVGELALDGRLRPIRGTLAAAIMCRDLGRSRLICPRPNAAEALLVEGIQGVVPVSNLAECLDFLRGKTEIPPLEKPERPSTMSFGGDMRDICGAQSARRALEIAAAGGHNVFLVGPPGAGKTMLAKRLPGILPRLDNSEALEVTRIYSIAGLLGEEATLIEDRPFRSPHHHISVSGLVGGGSGFARPGEISLAHNGVLFLDELSLYKRDVIDALRAPVEEGRVRIARSGGTISYPCRLSLIAASNPCPCGFWGDEIQACNCSQMALQSHKRKVSGPLMDRFDMQVSMKRLTQEQILTGQRGDPSEVVRKRVENARSIQRDRYGTGSCTNASAPVDVDAVLEKPEGNLFVRSAMSAGLTGRGLTRAWRVARTIADLEESDEISGEHLGEALIMRLHGVVSETAA